MIRRSKCRKRLPELTSCRGKYFSNTLVYLLSSNSDSNVFTGLPQSGASMKSTRLTWVASTIYNQLNVYRVHPGLLLRTIRHARISFGTDFIPRADHKSCQDSRASTLVPYMALNWLTIALRNLLLAALSCSFFQPRSVPRRLNSSKNGAFGLYSKSGYLAKKSRIG